VRLPWVSLGPRACDAEEIVRVLVVEDNVEIAGSIRLMLMRRKYAVDVAEDGEQGLDQLLCGNYDVAVIDVLLPKRDGFSLCRMARAQGVVTPLLILTARDAVEDRIRGLDCGADDYLIKPFAEGELEARLRALLRRAEHPLRKEILTLGMLTVDPAARCAKISGVALNLGSTEFRMLELLARNRGIALSRSQILERIWEYDFDGSSNIVDVYISQLRRKLKAAGAGARIMTVWGVGYKMEEDSER
jgi:DNA-binding response OmpR family regulator